MNGSGLLRGILVPIQHFFETYLDDIRWLGKRYYTDEGIDYRKSSKTKGIFTIQYPEEKLPVPEEFRYLPFLVYEEGADGEKNIRCTSCGICSKVCPPQCIWIVRKNDPVTGKPISVPEKFYIDIDICMNCGMCAEYCPFDAIKMDHEYEIASYSRENAHIYNKEKLMKPVSYYAKIRPTNYAFEETARAEKAAAKSARPGGQPEGN
ncbi:MAG: 4Fe-4S binding protein [Anaerolineaceae bacterium]